MQQKRETCFATLLQNEVKSNVKRATNQVAAVAKSVGAE